MNQTTGHTYYLLSRTNWAAAEAEAVRMGGHLVTIDDAAENEWVLGTFGNFGGAARNLFIGLTDEGHEGTWAWTSGESAAYLNWAAREPNNGYPGWPAFPYENYTIMYGSADPLAAGTWKDLIGTDPDQLYWGVVETVSQLSIRVSQVELCWSSLTGVVYQVQFSTSLSGGWTDLGPPVVGTIVWAARRGGVHPIVMGTHGKTGLKKALWAAPRKRLSGPLVVRYSYWTWKIKQFGKTSQRSSNTGQCSNSSTARKHGKSTSAIPTMM